MNYLTDKANHFRNEGADDIAQLLDEAAAEITRLNAAVKWEQNRFGRIGTHGPGCETWGPAHYECLLREIHRIRGEVK
jgi:hypothetical protein